MGATVDAMFVHGDSGWRGEDPHPAPARLLWAVPVQPSRSLIVGSHVQEGLAAFQERRAPVFRGEYFPAAPRRGDRVMLRCA